MDHAALAPLPRPTVERLRAYADNQAAHGDTNWLDQAAEVEQLRKSCAALIGAAADEIALTSNTTAGINIVAEGLDLREGDNIVTLADEYPANVYPWMNQGHRGVETRLLKTDGGKIDFEQLASVCDSRTRLLSISWVGFQTGYRQPLDKLGTFARERNLLFFVDAIQGLGVFPLDVRECPIDFLAVNGQKWMLGTEGAGFVYIRQECLDRLRPIGVGCNSMQRPYDFTTIDFSLKQTAGRYEGGSFNMPGCLALGTSIRLLLDLGIDNIAQQVLAFTDLCCEQLATAGANVAGHRQGDSRSGIVFFTVPGQDPNEFRSRCLAGGIALSCRGGRLRISPHAYNNQTDLDQLCDLIR
jgi:selenocysteine lyase/cysteine desulfurase